MRCRSTDGRADQVPRDGCRDEREVAVLVQRGEPGVEPFGASGAEQGGGFVLHATGGTGEGQLGPQPPTIPASVTQ